MRWSPLGVSMIAAITAGVYWKDRWLPTAAAAGAVGSLRIESDPAGAEVRLNGSAKGTTPLSLSVPAGQYTLTVQQGTERQGAAGLVTSGAVTVHHITWADYADRAARRNRTSLRRHRSLRERRARGR